ncbi:DUF6461 domain-containing protein [Lentzea chajnantorensis]
MSLPEPVVRADATDHYDRVLSCGLLPSDALCLTAVRGLSVGEALRRFDGLPGERRADLGEVNARSGGAHPDELPVVLADEVDGWVLLVEDNGWHGADREVLERLSAGTVAASAFWNVNLVSNLSLAHDGELLGAFDFVLRQERPAALVPYLEGLEFDDAHRMCAESLAFVERVSGVRLTEQWAAGPHFASVVVDLRRFRPSDPRQWLDVNEPGLLAWATTAREAEVRAAAEEVARTACAAAGVEPEATADDVLRDHRRVMELRWDRAAPPDPDLDPVARLQAAVRQRDTEPVAEREVEARAHARAAVVALRADDPLAALAGARYNAHQAVRLRQPRPRVPPQHAG